MTNCQYGEYVLKVGKNSEVDKNKGNVGINSFRGIASLF